MPPKVILRPHLEPRKINLKELTDVVPPGCQILILSSLDVSPSVVAEVLEVLRQRNAAISVTGAMRATTSTAKAGVQSSREPALLRYRAAEEAVRSLSKQLANPPRPAYQAAEQGGAREVDRAALTESVRRAFEARQDLLRQELAEFRGRLDRLARTLEDREREKTAIIEHRVEEVLARQNGTVIEFSPATNAVASRSLTSLSEYRVEGHQPSNLWSAVTCHRFLFQNALR